MATNSEKSTLLTSLRKAYQNRTPLQHRLICQTLTPAFPTHSLKKIKLITFYLQLRQGPAQISSNEYPKHSFLLKFNSLNPQYQPFLQNITSKGVSIAEGQFVCMLSYDKYLNVQILGETSVENEINFWQSSEYFCSMPAKKFVQLLRQGQVLRFRQGQTAFFQGQQITKSQSGSGVYIVRSGQFGYFRQNDGKQIETFRFGSGHIFGALQILQNQKQRPMTARCKTQNSVVYHFSGEVFRRLMLKYCELALHTRQHKLFKYLQNQGFDMIKSKSYSDSLGKTKSIFSKTTAKSVFFKDNIDTEKIQEDKERKAFPSIRIEQLRQTTGTTFFKTYKDSQKIQRDSLKNNEYYSLKKEGPFKVYPMISQRSNFISSEFKGLNKLFATKKDNAPIQKLQAKTDNRVWKRDIIYSFYRQSFYNNRKNQLKIEQ